MDGSGRRTSDRRCLLIREIAAGRIGQLRALLHQHVVESGLDEQAAEGFVFAVNEAMTNVVRHGGGEGTLCLFRDDELRCEVSDRGAGFTPPALDGSAQRPVPTAEGGLGLWLAAKLGPSVSVESGEAGTTVRVSVPLPTGGNEPVGGVEQRS